MRFFRGRLFSLMLIGILLLMLASCSEGEAGDADNSISDSAGASKVLRVLTDIDCLSNSSHVNSGNIKGAQGERGLRSFRDMLKYFGDTPNGLEVQLEILPADPDYYNSELTRIRVEIMSGGGPDVFLMSGFGGMRPYDTRRNAFFKPGNSHEQWVLFTPGQLYLRSKFFKQ